MILSSKDTPLDVDRQSLKSEEASGRHESDSSWFGWIREVSRYQWLVLIVAWLGWVFDAMDGALFSLVQTPSMTDLIGHAAPGSLIGFYAGVVSAVMLVGWALGGICFGIFAPLRTWVMSACPSIRL